MTEEDQHKTTIVLPDDLYRRIKRIAYDRGQSMGSVIRESLREAAGRYQPLPKSLGMGDSGRSDLSERVDELYEPDPWE